jgi:hypothetical protein
MLRSDSTLRIAVIIRSMVSGRRLFPSPA